MLTNTCVGNAQAKVLDNHVLTILALLCQTVKGLVPDMT
jgi:hypothetical protein